MSVGGSTQGHSVYRDEWHHVFCFREAEHAAAFRAQFGGAPFDPKILGGSGNWAAMRDKPKAESKLERWQRVPAKIRGL